MFRQVESAIEWTQITTTLRISDCYATFEYAQIWEMGEPLGTRTVGLHASYTSGDACYLLLMVPLDVLAGGRGRFEARTPYDFGGPWIVGDDAETTAKLFEEDLDHWLRRNGVVTEFARLHPFAVSTQRRAARFHAENYVIDLGLSAEGVLAKQHRKHRWAVRRAQEARLVPFVETTPSQELAKRFAQLYAATMERLDANVSYHFPESVLLKLCSLDNSYLSGIRLDDEVIASSLFVISENVVFYHLSASTRPCPPGCNNLLLNCATEHAIKTGARLLHLGGGSQSLRRFKSQLATGTIPYSVVKKVVDPEAYAAVCEQNGLALKGHGFPAFRNLLCRNKSS